MPRRKQQKPRNDGGTTPNDGVTIGREAELWAMADALRGSIDAAEYKHVVLANGSMSSSQSGEGEIRTNLIEAGLVDCMVALPGQLFYSTQVPACLWFLVHGRPRRGEILFIDARKLGRMVDRTHHELTDDEIARIAEAYHAWRDGADAYEDVPGFCKSASLDEIRRHGHVLTPGRYVGAEPQPEDREPFEEKMHCLAAELQAQQAEGPRLASGDL